MRFSLHQIQKKCREQNLPLFAAFIDFTKAFDSLNRFLLWQILGQFGSPDKIILPICCLHDNMDGHIKINNKLPALFAIGKQGCVPGPTLFALFLAAVFEYSLAKNVLSDFCIRVQIDGGLFNLRRLSVGSRFSRNLLTNYCILMMHLKAIQILIYSKLSIYFQQQ